MNYNKLKYFYSVSQTLNFTKSAEQLYVSQSAISRHMKELEEDFGVTLFIRTNRDLILTDAGKVLADEIRPFFSKEEELYQKVRAAAFGVPQRLNVGFMGIQPAYHVPAIVNEMILENQGLSVNLRRYNWDDIIPAINCNEIDVGIRLRMGKFEQPDLEHFVLDTDQPAMVVSSRHPLSGSKKAALKDFSNDTFLMLSKKEAVLPHTYTKKLFQKTGFSPKKFAEYEQAETILMLIHSDAGVSLLSRFAATDQFPDLHVINLEDMDPLYLELIWKKGNENAFIEIFKEKMYRDCKENNSGHAK